jgi:hypothetical protein
MDLLADPGSLGGRSHSRRFDTSCRKRKAISLELRILHLASLGGKFLRDQLSHLTFHANRGVSRSIVC